MPARMDLPSGVFPAAADSLDGSEELVAVSGPEREDLAAPLVIEHVERQVHILGDLLHEQPDSSLGLGELGALHRTGAVEHEVEVARERRHSDVS